LGLVDLVTDLEVLDELELVGQHSGADEAFVVLRLAAGFCLPFSILFSGNGLDFGFLERFGCSSLGFEVALPAGFFASGRRGPGRDWKQAGNAQSV